jgi:hypothetical protein
LAELFFDEDRTGEEADQQLTDGESGLKVSFQPPWFNVVLGKFRAVA